MEGILTTIREKDGDYLVSHLANSEQDIPKLYRLMEDPVSFERLLENPKVLDILEGRDYEGSLELLFYLLVRQAMRQEKIENRDVSLYLTRLLVDMNRDLKKLKAAQWAALIGAFRHIFSFSLNSEAIFSTLRKIGDKTLFMSGFFPEHVERKWSTPIRVCEEIGSHSYRAAALTEQAYKIGIASPLFVLSKEFRLFRETLNRISTRFFQA